MMRYIEAPEPTIHRREDERALFLAGGITGCPDWQQDLRRMLRLDNWVLFNPRRAAFDVTDKSAAENQIKWEFDALRQADAISFWFPAESLQPIALFELGAWSAQPRKPIFIGVHPNYPRRADILIQMWLLGRKSIQDTLPGLAIAIATGLENDQV